MKEFFDHYLKGAPAPDWLQYGVPRLKMQEHIDQRLKDRAEREKVNNPPATPAGGRGGGCGRLPRRHGGDGARKKEISAG